MWTADLYRIRSLLFRALRRPVVPKPSYVTEFDMSTDQIVYKLKLPKTPHQSDIAQRTLRTYINKELVRVEDVGVEEVEHKMVFPQDAEISLVLVYADDAKPDPNTSMSSPYNFIARDETPPPIPQFPFPVEYVGEEVDDEEPTDSTATNTTLPPPSDDETSASTDSPSTETQAPDESATSTETLPPVEDTATTETLPPVEDTPTTETLPPVEESATMAEPVVDSPSTEEPVSDSTVTEPPVTDTPTESTETLPPTEPSTDSTETEAPPAE